MSQGNSPGLQITTIDRTNSYLQALGILSEKVLFDTLVTDSLSDAATHTCTQSISTFWLFDDFPTFLRDCSMFLQVQEGDLDERVLEKLSRVTEEGGLVVLTQFEHALSNGSIRNKSAYLNGVIKSHQVANRMQPDLNSRLAELYKTDKLNGQELDTRCMDHLRSLTPQLADRALDAFLSKDLSSARNVSALFMSTLRQVCTRTDVALGCLHTKMQGKTCTNIAYGFAACCCFQDLRKQADTCICTYINLNELFEILLVTMVSRM